MVDELLARGPRRARAGRAAARPGGRGPATRGPGRRADPRRHPRRATPAGAALDGAEAVVHLAAIVGDPACARDPELSNEVNVEGSRALVADARELGRGAAGVRLHLLELRPHGRSHRADRRDRRAAPRVALRRAEGGHREGAPRVGERQRAPAAHLPALRHRLRRGPTACASTSPSTSSPATSGPTRRLEVFGERFWRPYIHVRDAARAVRTVLEAPAEKVAGKVFNAGDSDENYRKLDLVEIITGQARPRRRGVRLDVTRTRATTRSPSRRSAPSSASRCRTACPTASTRSSARSSSSASAIRTTAATGTDAVSGRPADPALRRRAGRARDRRRGGHAALRLAHHGPAHAGLRGRLRRAPRACSTPWRSRAAPPRSTWPTWPRAWGPATR